MRHKTWTTLAAGQAGVITGAQLRKAGLSGPQVGRLVQSGLLNRYARNLYFVRGASIDDRSRLWLGVLSCDGVLCARAAGFVWGMLNEVPEIVEVTIPRAIRRSAPPKIKLLRRELLPAQRTAVDGLPVTSRVVTALDLMSTLPWIEAVPFGDRALQEGWIRLVDVDRRLATPRYGNGQLAEALKVLQRGGESEAERLAVQLLTAAGISGFDLGYRLDGWEIDIAFVELMIAIEIDGFEYHRDKVRFHRDRTKQNHLIKLNWLVLRYTWADLVGAPERVLAEVAEVLEHRQGLAG